MGHPIMAQIADQIKAMGFQQVGWTPLRGAVSLPQYRSWLDQGLHGDMAYLQEHLPQKVDPTQLVPRAQSALVVSCDYFPEVPGKKDFPFKANRVALYAQGEDYHHWFKDRLTELCQSLATAFPDEVFWPATDSAPILERDLAYRAGLGWVGKNTCLIQRQQGSLFFIGEILTSLSDYPTLTPSADYCGTCRRCIDACPTQALTQERELDARLCISYWTIEAKTNPQLPCATRWMDGCLVAIFVRPSALGMKKSLATNFEILSVHPN